ncbi:MAG: 50S ribosomal protein L18Ae [Candidatus Bathyarchaeia archaeon]
MSEVKIFRVTGEIRKPNLKTHFRKEVIAIKPEHAIEKVYTELGSKHRVKRFHIKITSVNEISPQEIEDPLIRKMVVGEVQVGGKS